MSVAENTNRNGTGMADRNCRHLGVTSPSPCPLPPAERVSFGADQSDEALTVTLPRPRCRWKGSRYRAVQWERTRCYCVSTRNLVIR